MRLVAAILALCTVPALAVEPPRGSALAREALALCHGTLDLPPATRAAVLTSGLRHAQAAVDADPGDALAHFAVFCNLGRRVEADGLSFRVLRDVRQARAALDRALDLAPDFADAVAAKGALLFRLPRLLGGDDTAAERWLRRALALDPENVHTRVLLAEVLRAHGAGDEAAHVEAFTCGTNATPAVVSQLQ